MAIIQYSVSSGTCDYISNTKAIPWYTTGNFILGPHTLEFATSDMILSEGTLLVAKQYSNQSQTYKNNAEISAFAIDNGTIYIDRSKSGGSSNYANLNPISESFLRSTFMCCQSTTGISPFTNITTVMGDDVLPVVTNILGGIPKKSTYFQSALSNYPFAYTFPNTWAEVAGNYNSEQFAYRLFVAIAHSGSIISSAVPITYTPIGCTLTGPSEAEEGETVSVLVTPESGKIIRTPVQGQSISVYDKSGYIDFTYSNNTIQFTVPASS